ncbi:hypothetical protein LB504_008062 [Fusarium proliferatum]|nr:hypothetical protein LB504_008062 [Fusarium proliferatum]
MSSFTSSNIHPSHVFQEPDLTVLVTSHCHKHDDVRLTSLKPVDTRDLDLVGYTREHALEDFGLASIGRQDHN